MQGQNHGTYIRWQLRNRCARYEQSLSFNLYKEFGLIDSSHNLSFFSPKRSIFLHECATYNELPYNLTTMDKIISDYKINHRKIGFPVFALSCEHSANYLTQGSRKKISYFFSGPGINPYMKKNGLDQCSTSLTTFMCNQS